MAKKSSSSSKRESARPKPLAKSALAKSLFLTLILGAGSIAAQAYPTPPTPAPTSSPATPTPQPSGNVLPFDSGLTFVLDEALSSKSSSKGQMVRAHLKDPLVVGGRQIAPAGTAEQIKVVAVSAADIGDVYGFVDIFFEPMALPDGRTLPLRAPVSRLSPHRTSGHESTVQIEDTIEDQVIPYHFLYHIFRKGKNFVLNPGSEIPAQTEATLTALPNGSVAIQTPAPMLHTNEMPSSTFPVMPVATPFGPARGKKPGGVPTPSPTPSPTASPSASPSPAP